MEPYRNDDYAQAAERFAELARRHPKSPEARFYQGVSLLFLGRPAEAAEVLEQAASLAQGPQRDDAEWYLSLALVRADRTAVGVLHLDALCGRAGTRQDAACAALRSPPRSRLTSAGTLLSVALLLSGASTAAAQGPTEAPASVEDLLAQGFAHLDSWRFDQAGAVFEDALARAREQGLTRLEAEARRGRGLLLSRKTRFPEAWTELQEARWLFEAAEDRLGLGKTYRNLGTVEFLRGNREDARGFYEKALAAFEAVGDRPGRAGALRDLSFVAPSTAEGLALVERAWDALQGTSDRKLEGLVLHNWGDFLFAHGDSRGALEKLEAAALRLEEVGDQAALARVLTSLGRLQRAHGQHERALDHHRRTLRIQEGLGDKQGGAQSLDAIAVTLTHAGRYREAVLHYERALALARETGSRVPERLGSLGAGYLAVGEAARAVEVLEEALRLGDADEEHRGHLASALFQIGRRAEGLQRATEAVDLARAAGDTERLRSALVARARIREKLGQLLPALDDARAALAVIEGQRAGSLPADFLKRGFGDEHQAIYGRTVRLLDALDRPGEALETAEAARGRAFLDLLAAREAPIAPAPAPSLAEILETPSRLHSTLVSYWVGPESTIAWVVTADGRIRRHRVPASAARLARLVASASSGLAGPVSRGAATREPSSPEVEKDEDEVEPARPTTAVPAQLRLRGGGTVTLDTRAPRASRKLYDLLVRPLRADLPSAPGARLTIVPHGPLLKLSFAGLQDEKGRYLVESYGLHYTPAIGALRSMGQTLREGSTAAVLIADPALPPAVAARDELGPLPGARQEARDVARLLRPRGVVAFAGTEAREDHIRDVLADKAIIHFATHGVVRDETSGEAFLALAAGPAASADGRLTADEIYGLRLEADLVFLSACRTGAGQVSGDGVVGLTRAFLSAGRVVGRGHALGRVRRRGPGCGPRLLHEVAADRRQGRGLARGAVGRASGAPPGQAQGLDPRGRLRPARAPRPVGRLRAPGPTHLAVAFGHARATRLTDDRNW